MVVVVVCPALDLHNYSVCLFNVQNSRERLDKIATYSDKNTRVHQIQISLYCAHMTSSE